MSTIVKTKNTYPITCSLDSRSNKGLADFDPQVVLTEFGVIRLEVYDRIVDKHNNGTLNHESCVKEHEVIAKFVNSISGSARIPKPKKGVARPLSEFEGSTQPIKLNIKPMDSAEVIEALRDSMVKLVAPPQESIEDLMVTAMQNFVNSGDITNVVPNGKFSSSEERGLWKFVTMAQVVMVKGRTFRALKMSNDKPTSCIVTKPGIQLEVGKYALFEDQDKVVYAAVKLPDRDAEELSRLFNSLFRQ